MNKFYFAKNRNTEDFYIGNGNKVGFKAIGALKTSIILKDKKIEQYDLYYIDLSKKNIKLCKELRELNNKTFNLD